MYLQRKERRKRRPCDEVGWVQNVNKEGGDQLGEFLARKMW